MKKMYFTHALLAVALIACMPSYAAQAAQEQHEESSFAKAKHAAKKQFDVSIARLKKCVHGNCSRMEALKAVRDVAITVGVLYYSGRAVREGRMKAFQMLGGRLKEGQNIAPASTPASRAFLTATYPIDAAGYVATVPGLMVRDIAKQTGLTGAVATGYEKVKQGVEEAGVIGRAGYESTKDWLQGR